MTPSWRRYLRAAAAISLVLGVPSVSAQQTKSGAQTSPAAAGKAAPARAQAAKARPAQKKSAAKREKADPAVAQGQVEAGINALGQGRLDAAVASLSGALAAGSLPSAQTARALYYRGVAYRRQNKPALAISDLTNALWIKAGLTDEQRADALQQRSGAYREAGLPDQADPPSARKVMNAKAGSAATPFASVAPAAPAGSSTTLSSAGGFLSSLFGSGASTPEAPAPKAASTAAAEAPRTTASIPDRPAVSAAPAASASTSNGGRPATRSVPIYSSADPSMPAGFQDMGAPVRHVEVSTTARAGQAQAGPPPGTVARSWEDATRVRPVARPAANAATKVASAPVVADPSSAAQQKGRAAGASLVGASVVIQVAAVRSAQEAQGVTAKLKSQFGRELAGRAPVVDQVSAGNFGTFYRVQVGPYASVRDTEGLCAKLKSGGLDCRIVSQ